MGELRMSVKERLRLESLSRVKRGEITVSAASELMGMLRQARRLWKRYRELGDAGLVHRLRGRSSGRRLPEERRALIVKRHQERYRDFGPLLACEKLAEEGLRVSPNTLTQLLKERGLWMRRRHRSKHRRRRERRASFGSLVQMDGSHHDWFEGRAGKCVLMVIIDDATNRTYARFYPAETLDAAFDVLGRWIRSNGIPRGVYVDQHSIYRNDAAPGVPTQFGRAMAQLQVELILARSPQAKGRVERRNRVFQDRLVKELRLRGIRDMAQANALLEDYFLPELNRRYSIEPQSQVDLHRALELGIVLEEILCVQEKRVVGSDWCVRWRNRWVQISAKHASLRLPRRRVLVKELAGGRLVVEYGSVALETAEVPSRPAAIPKKRAIVNNRVWKPSANHPWNRGSGVGAAPRVMPAPAAPARALPAGGVT